MKKEVFLQQAIEQVLPPEIQRNVYRNTFRMLEAEGFLAAYHGTVADPITAADLALKLNSNMGTQFGNVPAKSAFFTWFRNQGLLVVETTTAGFTHDYLRAKFDYHNRVKQFGATLFSGHFCEQITFPNNEQFPVVLFDSVYSDDIISPKQREYLPMMTLAQHSILSLTTDGYVPYISDQE